MNHSAHRFLSCSDRSVSRQRLSRSQKYTTAKQLAINLLQQIEFYAIQSSLEGYQQTINKIIKLMVNCLDQHKGEILLIVCRSAAKLGLSMNGLSLPKNYFQFILKYIDSLLITESLTKHNSLKFVNQIYSGKRIVRKQIQVHNGRAILFDMFLIDRLDIFLKVMFYELRSQNNFSIKLSVNLRNFMVQSIKKIGILPQQDQQQFKNNVEWIILLSSSKPQSVLSKKSISQNYVLLDQYFDSQNQQSRESNNNEPRKYLPAHHKTSKKKSFLKVPSPSYQASENVTKRQGKLQRESSMICRKLKRGSVINNSLSKRSSIMMMMKNDEALARVSTRWTNKLSIAEVVTNSNRLARRSNFLQIKPKQLQSAYREVFPSINENPIILEQPIIEMDKQNNEYTNKSIREESQFDIDQIQPFYLFIQIKRAVHLIEVEEIKNKLFERHCKKLKFSMTQSTFLINKQLTLKQNQQQEDSIQEYIYQSQITQKICFYRDQHMGLRIKGLYGGQCHGNVLRVLESPYSILMGYVRKVSTYFIYIIKFQKITKYPIYEQGLKKKLFEGKKLHGFSLNIISKLMNSDLSICFQEQEKFDVKKGNVFLYIQNEQYRESLIGFKQQDYHLIIQHNSIKQLGQVRIKQLWGGHLLRKKSFFIKKKAGKTNSIQKMYKIPSEFIFEQKKLKKTALNKNSINIDAQEFDSILSEISFSKNNSGKTSSKIDLTHFESKTNYSSPYVQRHQVNKLKIRKKTPKSNKQSQFIQTIKTDKGYTLVMRKQKGQIDGQRYENYYGYLQSNPQLCAFYKHKETFNDSERQNYLKSKVSLHGCKDNKNSIQNICLITFIKPIKIEQTFQGYLISSIKILTSQENGWIFIETYWQKMSKYYIFILSSQMFQRLTQINTISFKQKPFFTEMTSMKKYREKRTSVVASLIKNRETEFLNSSKLKKIKHPISMATSPIEQFAEGVESSTCRAYQRSKFTQIKGLTINQMPTINKGIKTNDNYSTFKNMKSSQKNVLKRQIITRLKNKIIRCSIFVWRKHTLYLQIKYPCSSQLQALPNTLEFQGNELAVKNVYSSNNSISKAQATELILIRYKQSNMANLSIYNTQALSKISFEHIYIKNNCDLYGKYISSIKLADIAEEKTHYQLYNSLLHNIVRVTNLSKNKIAKTLFSKASSRQQQRKFTYQELISLAKGCCLPYQAIQSKKRKMRDNKFLIPNRHRYLMCSEFVYKIQIEDSQIKLKKLSGQILQTLTIERLECFFPYIRKLGLKQIKTLLVKRVLQDEDLIRMCFSNYK